MKTKSTVPSPVERLGWIALAALALVVYLGKSYETLLPPNDTGLHALISMKMTSQGAAPLLPVPGVASYSDSAIGGFNDHPFTLFYINGWMMRWLGPSSWSARFLPGVFAAGTVILTGILGALLYSRIFGFIAALFLLFTVEYIKRGAAFHLDHPMIFFILLSFILWLKGRWTTSGIAAGIGAIVKTPVALLLIPVSLIVLYLEGDLKKGFSKWLQQVVAAIAVIVVFWGLTASIGGIDVVRDYWSRQVFGTAVAGRNFGRSIDWLLFFKYVLKWFMPWTLVLLAAIGVIAKKKAWRERRVLVPLVSCVVLFMTITPVRFKYDYYFLPAFPFVALLAVNALEKYLSALQKRLFSGVAGVTPVLLAALLVFPIQFAPEMFPALRRFNAYIQSYGDCSDRVIFVSGGQPYADGGEYKIETTFFTGREFDTATCQDANQKALRRDVKWMILSRQSFDRCLSSSARSRFKDRLKFGGLHLLSVYSLRNETGVVDLTPLERELLPVTDCRSADFPRDRYHSYE